MKELHIYLNGNYPPDTITNYADTMSAIETGKEIVITTQPHFCSFDWALDHGYNLCVHMLDDSVIWPKIGSNDFTDKELRRAHRLEKMLLAGAFNH